MTRQVSQPANESDFISIRSGSIGYYISTVKEKDSWKDKLLNEFLSKQLLVATERDRWAREIDHSKRDEQQLEEIWKVISLKCPVRHIRSDNTSQFDMHDDHCRQSFVFSVVLNICGSVEPRGSSPSKTHKKEKKTKGLK